jgi:hypothetical protein
MSTREIKETLLRAGLLFAQVNPDHLLTALDRHMERMVAALRAAPQAGLSEHEAEEMQAGLLQVDEAIRKLRQEWFSSSGVARIADAVSGMRRQCEEAIILVDEVAGQPPAEAVHARHAIWLASCALSMVEFSRAADHLQGEQDAPFGRASSAVGSTAGDSLDHLGENWGRNVVPPWLEWLFNDVLNDASGESLREYFAFLGVEPTPEAQNAFYDIQTRESQSGDTPNWKKKAAKDPARFVRKGLATSIRLRAGDEDRRSHVKAPPDGYSRWLEADDGEDREGQIDHERQRQLDREMIETFLREEASDEEREIMERLLAGAGGIEAAGSKAKWQSFQRRFKRRRKLV